MGDLRFVNYLDEDVLGIQDDLLRITGTPGQADFRLGTLDGAERIGFSQGGVYSPGLGLTNATYTGFAADQFNLLQNNIESSNVSFTLNGNISSNLPKITDPARGIRTQRRDNGHGLERRPDKDDGHDHELFTVDRSQPSHDRKTWRLAG